MKTGSITLDGFSVSFMTKHTGNRTAMPVFAIHIDPAFLDEVIQDNSAFDIIYIPWKEVELAHYLQKYPNSILLT